MEILQRYKHDDNLSISSCFHSHYFAYGVTVVIFVLFRRLLGKYSKELCNITIPKRSI